MTKWGEMHLSDLLKAINPLGYFDRRFRQIDRRLKQSAEFDQTLGLGLIERFTALDGQLAARTEELRVQIEALHTRLDGLDNAQDRMSRHLDHVRTRFSSYLGSGIALTYLADGTPILVNSNDIGCPLPLLVGGRWEENNTMVLLSFVEPETVFLDIGANVGFFSMLVARRLAGSGHVYAFEPHPGLVELLRKNLFLNQFDKFATCFPLALSDQNGTAALYYPTGHLGGGRIVDDATVPPENLITSDMRRLDDLLGPAFSCDLVKIDVEGHELGVLRGMRRIVENSPCIKILFEKLEPDTGEDSQLEGFFRECGFDLYGVEDDASLSPLRRGGLGAWTGYALGARPGTIDGGLRRTRFAIHPCHLMVPGEKQGRREILHRAGERGTLFFYGPFWFLRAGMWRLRLIGTLRGSIMLVVQESFGAKVLEFELHEGQAEHVFASKRDLPAFELAAFATSDSAEITVERLELIWEA